MPAKPLVLAVASLLAVASCGTAASRKSVADRAPVPETPASTAPPSLSPSQLAKVLKDTPTGYDPSRNAPSDISAALVKARTDKRPVLLDFGADWCPECRAMLRVYREDEVLPMLSRYHVVAVNVGRFNRNLDVAHRYGLSVQRTGIPAFVVLAPSGEVKVVTEESAFTGEESVTPRKVNTFLSHWWQ
ncbi:thioredoxin family protein [Actinomadura rupiterrae]|uniref:thioredoxin family protein n=1 Tax=Actinomadura rupiterrae TaxID=559627 RepID=UPI0020A5B9FD|nr:thioredoxin family protein [Actinomadura rupiterrae]MCP2336583.1 protein disulfide-isomerase [Actinomadura rupiterrae]